MSKIQTLSRRAAAIAMVGALALGATACGGDPGDGGVDSEIDDAGSPVTNDLADDPSEL